MTASPSEKLAVIEGLEGSADYIAVPYQWCRGTYVETSWDPIAKKSVEAACLVGAIWKGCRKATEPSLSLYHRIQCLTFDYLAAEIDSRHLIVPRNAESVLINFNDAQRDKRKVIRLLKRVARQLRKEVQDATQQG